MITIKVFCTNYSTKVIREYKLSQMWEDWAQQVYDLIGSEQEFLRPISATITFPWGLQQEMIF
jgi:hypothetical protein